MARVGSKRFSTVDDLSRHRSNLTVQCRRCNHQQTFTADQLLLFCDQRKQPQLLESSRSLLGLLRRMRCSKCRSLGADCWVTPP